MGTLFLIFCAFMVYCLPGMIASKRNHRNSTAINVLNIFAGFTVIGWVAALVWACTDDIRPAKIEPGAGYRWAEK